MEVKFYWWHEKRYYGGVRYEVHPCTLGSEINGVVANAMAEVNGAKLGDTYCL
jgi:hypothetical protein